MTYKNHDGLRDVNPWRVTKFKKNSLKSTVAQKTRSTFSVNAVMVNE